MSYKRLSELLSKHRKFLMGFAIIWIMIFHSSIQTNNFVLQSICYNGYAGVDIFMLLSGFGVYHSLLKDDNPINFYKRRAKRILPKYYFVLILYSLLTFYKIHKGLIDYSFLDLIKSCILNAGLFFYLFDYKLAFNWYIFMITYMYALSPFLYKAFKRNSNKTLYISFFAAFLIYLINIFLAPKYQFYFNLSARTFPFLLGMYIASKSNDENKINLIFIYLISAISFLFRVYPLKTNLLSEKFGYQYICMTLVVYGLILLLINICERIKNIKIYSIISAIGIISFELYLINVTFYQDALIKLGQLMGYGNLPRLLFIIINLILGILMFILFEHKKRPRSFNKIFNR